MITIISNRRCGKYDFPELHAVQHVPKELLPFNLASGVKKREGLWLHFFIDDYRFEKVWKAPSRYLELMRKFDGVIAPDFSMMTDMPVAQQIYNCCRNRVLSVWMQENGIKVIPCVEWSDRKSLEWCLDGLPKHSVLAVQTNGSFVNVRKKMSFIKGMEVVVRELEPTKLLIYGRGEKEFKHYFHDAVWFESYSQQLCKRL